MITPIDIRFRGMEPSPAIETLVRKQARALDIFGDRITACHVVVERPHRHHHKGGHVQVRIDLTIPDGQIIVNRDPTEHAGAAEPAVAVREAFHSARRQVQKTINRRHEVHAREEAPTARVVDVTPDHGFLLTSEGREIYFHRNAVLGDGAWDHLDLGDEVRFVEEEGINGPQASTVIPLTDH